MSDVTRRDLLKAATCVVGAACVGSTVLSSGEIAHADTPATLSTTLPYSRTRLANIKQLSVGKPLELTYPDRSSPISLVRTGQFCIGGVGPDGDVVAFSRLCAHMGAPLNYKADTNAFHCPLHFALFDATKGGLTVIGQATDNLPQVELEVDSHGNIYAIGVKGLIYGRQANVLH